MRTALTIAGSDSSGGAGIQADIKTMTANGVFAMSAITALTAQNTTGVSTVSEVTPEFLAMQIDAVFEDIFPDSVKIGMVASAKLIEIIADKLETYGAKNIVVDPVMIATSGAKLIKSGAVDLMKKRLFPLSSVITPNISEAEVLTGMKIDAKKDMVTSAKKIYEECGCRVLLKGGHLCDAADDLLYDGEERWLLGNRIENPNTHGTGCTLSSAIASNLAKGFGLYDAVLRAKDYISGAISANLNLGKGSGPLNHMFDLKSKYIGGNENE